MDKKELQKNIATFYAKLPKVAQDFFSSMEWMSKLENISTKYRLSEENKQNLVIETTLVLLAMIHPVEYEEILTKEINLPNENQEAMFVDIEMSILGKIKQSLIDTYNQNIKENGANNTGSEKLENKLNSRFEKLPEDLQGVILASDYQNKLYEISQKYKLSISQMGALDTITTDLIVGDISPREFKQLIIKTVRIGADQAEQLVNDINTQIFKKIREKLVAMTTGAPNKDKILNSLKEDELGSMQVEIESLKEHGIEIEEQAAPAQTQTKANPQSLEIKPDIHPMLAQKLSTPVTMPIKTNSYGWNNPPKVVKEETPKTVAPKKSGYDNGVDPYRTPIE